MNPQDSNKKLQQKQDVKNAISDYQGIERNDDSLNTSASEFANSSTVPEACFLLGETQFDNSDEFSWRYEARAKL